MGSLNDKLNKTQQSKEDIKAAIEAAGGVINDNTPLSGYDEAIEALEILDSAMKQDINKLINSSSDYKTKLNTAVNNLSTYLNTLSSYINPNYSSGGSYLTPKLNNLNSQMYNLISNIRSRIVNNLGGSVSAYNLQAIYTALGNIDVGEDVLIETKTNSSSTSTISFSSNHNSYDRHLLYRNVRSSSDLDSYWSPATCFNNPNESPYYSCTYWRGQSLAGNSAISQGVTYSNGTFSFNTSRWSSTPRFGKGTWTLVSFN